MDGERVPDEWVGQGVVVRLASIEARGVEIPATLDEIRDDGVALSQIGELGPGPITFCPWDSVGGIHPRSAPPHDRMLEGATRGESETIPEGFRGTSVRTLQRVVPVVQKASVGSITVALDSVERHEGGDGVLRFLISSDTEYLGMPEPEVSVRDVSGHSYRVLSNRASSSGDETEVSMHALGLPEPAELEADDLHLTEIDHRHGDAEGASWEDPSPFRFTQRWFHPPTPWASVSYSVSYSRARPAAGLCAPPRRPAGRSPRRARRVRSGAGRRGGRRSRAPLPRRGR